MDLFHAGPVESKKITGEACIHHLWFSDADYDQYGMRIKWNPAIKTQADRNALRSSLITKKLDIISTDHAPHLLKEKTAPYVNAASGGPMVQHSLQAMLELGNQGIISLPEIAEKMAHNPALRFKIKDRGFIRQGYYADLVLVNPRQAYTVNNKNTLYKCGWSPFEDQTFSHSISKTMVNGEIVFDGTQIVEKQVAMPLYFDR
jgi:dihydroorotase